MRDIGSNIQVTDLGAQTLSGTTPNASAWVDVRGFDAAAIMLATRAVTDAGTAAGFTATMQHGDDSTAAGAADCVAADAVGGVFTLTVTADDDDNIIVGNMGYIGNKRYVRVNIVGTTGTSAVVNAYGVLAEPNVAETTFVGASVAAT